MKGQYTKSTQTREGSDGKCTTTSSKWSKKCMNEVSIVILQTFIIKIYFSHMNWSIPSYSVGKWTIRMMHVHIVIQCHSQGNTHELVKNSVTCCSCRQTLSPFNFTTQSLASRGTVDLLEHWIFQFQPDSNTLDR